MTKRHSLPVRTLSCCAAFVLLATVLPSQIQLQRGFTTPPLGEDTLCFRYRFLQGDTLVYVVESADSISFPGQPTLLKVRREVLTIACDSVTPDEHYYLSMVMHESMQRQTTGTDSAEVKDGPWIRRSVTVLMDSVGRRLDLWVDDPSQAAVSPGGAFQPIPLPTLGESCGVQNQSWLVTDTTSLVENAIPPPAFEHSTLWRVLDAVDTLGSTFHQIQYTQTALGRFVVRSASVDMDLRVTIAAFGKLSLDKARMVPYHLFATSEDKVDISTSGGRSQKGKHHVSTHYQLVAVASSDPDRRFRIGP
jgi:hypothetical protein